MSDKIFIFIFILIFAYFGICLNIRPYKKARKLIAKWADDNGYRVIEKEKKIGFNTGPYIFGGYTAIHKIVIVDKYYKTRTAWTKTGKYFWPFSNAFKAKIEKPWTEDTLKDRQPNKGVAQRRGKPRA